MRPGGSGGRDLQSSKFEKHKIKYLRKNGGEIWGTSEMIFYYLHIRFSANLGYLHACGLDFYSYSNACYLRNVCISHDSIYGLYRKTTTIQI